MATAKRSGTVGTLAALVAAMIIVTCVLLLMETPPAHLAAPAPLQADRADESNSEASIIHQTNGVPLQHLKWRNIVVHDTSGRASDAAAGCHFLIGGPETLGDGIIRPTHLWRQQLDGNHIIVPGYSYNKNSIGIRLLRRTNRQGPTPKQMATLVKLVRSLQAICQISRDHVYLGWEMSEPGRGWRFFPAESFRARLIPASSSR